LGTNFILVRISVLKGVHRMSRLTKPLPISIIFTTTAIVLSFYKYRFCS